MNHISNGLENLKEYAEVNDTGERYYNNETAVRDGNVVTASRFFAQKFCRKILCALEADTPKR